MTSCPLCGKEARITITEYDIPYFGKALLFVTVCECGYRYSDVMIPEAKEGAKYTIKVKEETLTARVVKSSSATIKIPELEVEVVPGAKSEGYISNVEGVLLRIEDAVKIARDWNRDDEEKVKKCDEIIKAIEEARAGKRELTLIIEDPTGNSAIIHELAEKEDV
jgi:zinc finger protein